MQRRWTSRVGRRGTRSSSPSQHRRLAPAPAAAPCRAVPRSAARCVRARASCVCAARGVAYVCARGVVCVCERMRACVYGMGCGQAVRARRVHWVQRAARSQDAYIKHAQRNEERVRAQIIHRRHRHRADVECIPVATRRPAVRIAVRIAARTSAVRRARGCTGAPSPSHTPPFVVGAASIRAGQVSIILALRLDAEHHYRSPSTLPATRAALPSPGCGVSVAASLGSRPW
jgi:hypothetical protein